MYLYMYTHINIALQQAGSCDEEDPPHDVHLAGNKSEMSNMLETSKSNRRT